MTSEEQLIWVNQCRLFLCALTLLDIVDGSGNILLDQAWHGKPLETQHNKESWSYQAKPPPKAWEILRTALKKTFLGRGRYLRHPLGMWRELDPNWKWYLCPQPTTWFRMEDGVWYMCKLDRRICPRFSINSSFLPKPDTLLRAKVTVYSEFIVLIGAGPIEAGASNFQAPFLQYLAESEEVGGSEKPNFRMMAPILHWLSPTLP